MEVGFFPFLSTMLQEGWGYLRTCEHEGEVFCSTAGDPDAPVEDVWVFLTLSDIMRSRAWA